MSAIEIRVSGRYRLEQKIFQGRSSFIYEGVNVQSEQECAIKGESKIGTTLKSQVLHEGRVLQEVQGGVGIPRLYWCGQNGDFNFVIEELLGPSLEEYFQQCQRRFSLKTLLMIGDKLITTLQYIHYKGVLHRDIQPTNCCVGLGSKLHHLYLIDYAQSTTFMSIDGTHRSQTINPSDFYGSLLFSSMNMLKGHRPSRRDDLESLALMLIYFAKGELPWGEIQDLPLPQAVETVRKIRQKISIDQLCEDVPDQCKAFLRYTLNLSYDEEPDYGYLKRLLKEKLIKEGFHYDHIFDWLLLPLRMADCDPSLPPPFGRAVRKHSDKLTLTLKCNGFFTEDLEFWKINKIKVQAPVSKTTISEEPKIPVKTVQQVKQTKKQHCIIY